MLCEAREIIPTKGRDPILHKTQLGMHVKNEGFGIWFYVWWQGMDGKTKPGFTWTTQVISCERCF